MDLTGTGCSNTMEHSGTSVPGHDSSRPKTATLDVEKAKEKAKAVSSQIYELIGIRTGKATQPGPSISTCDQDPEHLYKTVHPWSVYDVSEDELKAGFQRLREALPAKGWNILSRAASVWRLPVRRSIVPGLTYVTLGVISSARLAECLSCMADCPSCSVEC
ncbi:hypothetical protein ABZ299_01800 [Streptomyces sp. NPDC006184]|uniref:hypothetical protein n=1 Tax=Streptomyces sp. NPDC006184 TaxID=3155455 RepID=UPI0033A3DED7